MLDKGCSVSEPWKTFSSASSSPTIYANSGTSAGFLKVYSQLDCRKASLTPNGAFRSLFPSILNYFTSPPFLSIILRVLINVIDARCVPPESCKIGYTALRIQSPNTLGRSSGSRIVRMRHSLQVHKLLLALHRLASRSDLTFSSQTFAHRITHTLAVTFASL